MVCAVSRQCCSEGLWERCNSWDVLQTHQRCAIALSALCINHLSRAEQ